MHRFRQFFRIFNRRYVSRINSTFYGQYRYRHVIPTSIIGTGAFALMRSAYPIKAVKEEEEEMEAKLTRRQQR